MMALALLGSASADSWLADAYVEMPWAITVEGRVSASMGQADAFRVLVHLDCERTEREQVCTIQDAALQARAAEPHRGRIDDELRALRDGILGATLTLTYRADGSLSSTPDLDNDRLSNPQRELTEGLLGRAMVGFDLPVQEGETWLQEENYVAMVPGAYGGGSMAARHTRDGDTIRTQGKGTTRTPGGSPFALQFGAEARVDEAGLVDRWWWAVGRPMVSAVTAASYIQGGLLYRIDDGAQPLVGIGSGEIDMSGPSLDAAVLGTGAYDSDREFDVAPPPADHALWVRGAVGAQGRPSHNPVGTGELLVGYAAPRGLRLGAGLRAHTPREHTLLYDAHPVAARDVVAGFWFRPPRQDFAPHLGLSWVGSFRRYPGANPDRIFIPAMAGDLGADIDLGPVLVGAFARAQIDLAVTIAEHGPSVKTFETASVSAGLHVTWRAWTWAP